MCTLFGLVVSRRPIIVVLAVAKAKFRHRQYFFNTVYRHVVLLLLQTEMLF